MAYFDAAKWREALARPDWYLALADDYEAVLECIKAADEVEAEAIKLEVREFFEVALAAGEVALAADGPDMDAARQPIDTVVIHHTSNKDPYTLPRMNAMHLLNLYVPYYRAEGEDHGKPICSGHFDEAGKQVFYGYHWLVRRDGSVERLLPDSAIGWQAGSWDVNTRSVGICLDNDYENDAPSGVVLAAVAGLIREHYGHVLSSNVVGHGEVSTIPTVCPGNGFKSDWKAKLVGLVEAQ